MKDYKKLEGRINKGKEITIGDITDLGYSRYDINQFIEAGILSRSKRGLYIYLPEIEKVEEQPAVEETKAVETQQVLEEPAEVDPQQVFSNVNQGIYNLMKRQNEEAINCFNNALELDPTNDRAFIGLIAAYAFLEKYQRAYEYVVKYYNNRDNNSLLYNVYYYLLLLKEHVTIDEQLLSSVKEEIDNNKETIKKQNPNFKRLHKAIENDDYLEALKFANFSISIDKKDKKYHVTNHIYKALIMATLRLKGIDPYQNRTNTVVEEPKTIIENVEEQEEIIVVPPTKVEDTIKVNLLMEAISSNNYDLALTLLEQENIDNPLEVIKTLLLKLSTIKSLLTSTEPVKVVTTEPVRVVEEETLVEAITPVEESTPEVLVEQSVVETSPIIEKTVVEEKTTQEELINIAYKAYKDAYHSEQFDEASKNLRRYEYLNNSNGTQRNINYHRIRIEKSKKDFEQNPERYVKKKALSRVIFDLKRERRYDAALAAIAEFKSLGGIKNELVVLVEAEIYFALGDYAKTSMLLNELRNSEEPSYFILASKLAWRNYKFQDALSFCQAYNERRPNQSPSNYQLMGDCYTKLGKPGKAIKFYRKAEEVAAQYGGKQLDLSSKISRQEMFSEFKKEERTARSLGKKK